MVFAGVGCFAKVPNMKNYDNRISYTETNEKTYNHKEMLSFKEFNNKHGKFLYCYDSLTKHGIYIFGTEPLDTEKLSCVISCPNGDVEFNDEYVFTKLNDANIFSFEFERDNELSRVLFWTNGQSYFGYIQSFEVR